MGLCGEAHCEMLGDVGEVGVLAFARGLGAHSDRSGATGCGEG